MPTLARILFETLPFGCHLANGSDQNLVIHNAEKMRASRWGMLLDNFPRLGPSVCNARGESGSGLVVYTSSFLQVFLNFSKLLLNFIFLFPNFEIRAIRFELSRFQL